MKTIIYLTGHHTFSNRGCEAIVRSTVSAFRAIDQHIQFLVPSSNIPRDSSQWRDASNCGVSFVPAYLPPYNRYWVHAQRLPIPSLKRSGWPFPLPQWLKKDLNSADAVLSIGGDNYSLDYRLPSLLQGMDGAAVKLGKPVILWGASVGPFEAEPSYLPLIKKHLSSFAAIKVRESVSWDYLTKRLGLVNVDKMVDSAFGLQSEEVECNPFWVIDDSNGVLGLNVSPLIENYNKTGLDIRKELVEFIRLVVRDYGYSVMLIPHVIPLDGAGHNNDFLYLNGIFDEIGSMDGRVGIVPGHLNAAQVKYVISRCRFFIGARTHATIAALSSLIPTISIAYSVKAIGINRDLFGSDDNIISVDNLTSDSLLNSFLYARDKEDSLKRKLKASLAEYQDIIQHATVSVLKHIK